MAGVNNPAGEIDGINAVGAIQGAFGVGNVQGINAAGDINPENAVAGDINPENAAAGAQAVAGDINPENAAAGDINPENAAAGAQAVAGDINPENAAAGDINPKNAAAGAQAVAGDINPENAAAGDINPENAAAGAQAVAGDINPENAAARAQAVAGTGGVRKFISSIWWCCGLRKRSGFVSGLKSNEPVYFPDWFYKDETVIPKWKMSADMMKDLLDLEEQDERVEHEDVSSIEKKAEKAVFMALGVTTAIDTVVNLPAIVIAKVGAGVGWSIAVFIPAAIGITVACYGAYRKVMRLKHPIKKALVVTQQIRDEADFLGIQSENAARNNEWDEEEAERVNYLKGRGRAGLRAIPGVYLTSVGAIYVLGMLAIVCLCFGNISLSLKQASAAAFSGLISPAKA